VSLGHEDVAVGRDQDVVRLIQQPRPRRLVPRARLTFRPADEKNKRGEAAGQAGRSFQIGWLEQRGKVEMT